MGKPFILLMVLFCIVISVHGDLTQDKNWVLNYFNRTRPNITQFQLYVQDILSGPARTTVLVAAANSTRTSPTYFGLVAVLDDPVRTAPTPDAKIVGRVEGLYAYASLEEITIQVTFDIVFVGGAYNGSSLSVVGHNSYLRPRRELSIVGGAGVFRLAHGFIGIRTVFLNTTTGDAFFEYNITVLH